jgi:hypothetical protein
MKLELGLTNEDINARLIISRGTVSLWGHHSWSQEAALSGAQSCLLLRPHWPQGQCHNEIYIRAAIIEQQELRGSIFGLPLVVPK